MKVTMNLNPSELCDLVDAVDKEITVTGLPVDFQKFAEAYVGNAELYGNEIAASGTITEIQTDCYPMLITIKTGTNTALTFSVDEPARIELENKAKVGLKLSVALLFKPKYQNGDFYYDVRLKNYKFV